MTDNDIKKALECHIKLHCWNDCPNATEERQLLNKSCSRMIAEDALDLINRQQAEIEKLERIIRFADRVIKNQEAEIERLGLDIMQASGRGKIAIKEFWKKFDEVLCQNIGPSRRLYWRILEAGNNLVAEMTESPIKIEHSSLCETDTYEVKE